MRENLVKARSTIIFIIALISATMLALYIERRMPAAAKTSQAPSVEKLDVIERSPDVPALPAPRPLTDQEKAWARTAWKYFENNTDPKTGLANSVHDYPATTMWDTGSYLLGLISARRLGIITEKDFDQRIEKALRSLSTMALFDGAVPNKSYNTNSLAMIDYVGKPAPNGIGWSAIDLGRLLVPLHIVAFQHPKHAAGASAVITRWSPDQVTQRGKLFGASVAADGAIKKHQEGRLGYEQYAAKTFLLMGMDAHEAVDYRPHLTYVDIQGIRVPTDARDPAKFGAQNFLVSEPFILNGIEFGWDAHSQEMAWRVYRAQEERYRKSGVLTAVTEDHIDKAPYFVYNSVFADGKTWRAITESGEDASQFRSLSTKAAFAWHALYQSDYTSKLMAAVESLHEKDKGWYAGVYEEGNAPNKALAANTNGVILESLDFIAHGKLISVRKEVSK